MATGIVYDDRMAEHKCLWDLNYNEKPERFTSVLKRCEELQLLRRCHSIKARNATEEELLKLHTPEMISILKESEKLSDEAALEELSSHYDFLYIHPSTYSLSLLAAGSTVELVSQMLDDKVRNGMAIIRPPGHHAMKSEYCGYCFYNNVAIAAQYALDNHGIKRVLIVDWDIHHGQATQQMFYEDPRVLYFSIHGYQNGAFWPHLRESDYHNIGRGAGLGYNVNVPMNDIKMGNGDYLAIFQQLLLPIAYEFNPELVIVSAGYDAALGCPEGEMEITPACYSHFTKSLMGLANGRVAVVLEGGYCLKSLSEGAALTLRTLLGDPCPVIPNLDAPTLSARNSILSIKYVLRKYWKCLQDLKVFDTQQIKDAKSINVKQFWPRIEFLGNDEKPDRYPTRDICPVQDPDVAASLDAQLDAIIAATSLKVPQYPVAFSGNAAMELSDVLQRCYILPLDRADTISQENSNLVSTLIDSLVGGKCLSGVSVTENSSNRLVDVLKYAVDHRHLEKVMFVDLRGDRDILVPKTFQEDPRVLCVSLFAAVKSDHSNFGPEFVGLDKGKGYTINIDLPQAKNCDAEVLAAVFRILLPIAYQYGPQLVVVSSDNVSAESQFSSNCFGQIVHLLSPLAGGSLAVIFDQNPTTISLEVCVKALLGEIISVPNVSGHQLDESVVSRIRHVIQTQNPYWSAFCFDIEFPDINVLIPPWMDDSKVLQYNQELHYL